MAPWRYREFRVAVVLGEAGNSGEGQGVGAAKWNERNTLDISGG